MQGPTAQEFRAFATGLADRVELHFSRTGGVDQHDLDAVIETGRIQRLQRGIELLRPYRPHAIAIACTCASFGYPSGAWTQVTEMRRRAGVPVTSATVALAAGCKAVGASRVALAAPYPEEITGLLVDFLEEDGIQVLGHRTLGIPSGEQVSQLPEGDVYDFILGSDLPTAQAVLVPDTALFTLEHISRLEDTLGKFVLTANQCTMWHVLRLAGLGSNAPAFGRLMAYDEAEKRRGTP